MIDNIKPLVDKIDQLIRTHLWFDFHVFKYDGKNLIIAGSIDLGHYHTLEIVFEGVFFVQGFFTGWHSDTSKAVFTLPNDEALLSKQFEIEQGYSVFIFKTEDYQNDIIIAAEKLSFNTDTVFYYEREDLKGNERIADFVKGKVL